MLKHKIFKRTDLGNCPSTHPGRATGTHLPGIGLGSNSLYSVSPERLGPEQNGDTNQ